MRYRWIGHAPAGAWPRIECGDDLLPALLAARGIVNPEGGAEFLSPTLATLGDPFAMAGLDAAACRIVAALRTDEAIAVYGDYDVDGVASTALLTGAFRRCGFSTVEPYIPDRNREGYGLNITAIDKLIDAGVRLIVSVDCGVTNHQEVAHARARGVDLIVLDHHQVQSTLPSAIAVVDPQRVDCQYPFKGHAAVGVAYTLLRGLARRGVRLNGHWRENEPDLLDALDLVALGTVADVVPLQGENRALVARGLEALQQAYRPGISALLDVARTAPVSVRAWHIAYLLGPRLNAAGRMANPAVALRLLLTDSMPEARELALRLDRLNTARQQLLQRVLNEAERRITATGPVDDTRRYLQVDGAGWSAGIVGLVAGRLTERYTRPVLVLDRGEAWSTGSARSIDGFNIAEALERCADLLARYGGHAKAAGLTVSNDNLEALEDRLTRLATERLDPDQLRPTVQIDAEVPPALLTSQSAAVVEQLEPFGHGNLQPILLVRGRHARNAARTRDGAHLYFDLAAVGGAPVRAVAFRQGDRLDELKQAVEIDVVGSLRSEVWQGHQQLSFHVLDFRPAPSRPRAP